MTQPRLHQLHAKAALFDLDGTLVATEHRSRAAWTRLFTAHGLPCDDATLATFVGRRGQEALADHVHRFPGSTVEELFEEACGYLMGPDIPPPFAVPGAAELLADLSARGVPLAVVTSGLRAHATELLDHVGGAGLFQVLVTAEDVSAGKPDPQGYLAACDALGVHPADGLAFEDAPAGVRAATTAGLRCVALTTTHPEADLAHADLVLPDLTTLRWSRDADTD
ncbi:HAD family phosphatase [Streptomyces durbertensis]|uniref:HAD family phosphatase n=1 Tax=Streptomyces durbertensis TaxID=2448886 RepID=A0ABR6EC40_9ACTN|nr:HAD family phosphatase [Streptomyces durbertensis]MBB1242900.1 HAD family phosphatase [Streptomyces durbertensis]